MGTAIALGLRDAFARHPTIPEVRCGLARGEVMLRDGDVFGPVVHLAARAVSLAGPSDVLTTPDVADDAGRSYVGRGRRHLKGMVADVELVELTG